MSDGKFIKEGMPPIFPISENSLGEVIYQNILSNTKKRPLLINGHTGESLSSAGLLQKTCTLATALRNYGYGPGTVAAISSKNNLEFFVPVIASLYIGATVTTINHAYTPIELNHVLNISKPRIIFCSKEYVAKYEKIRENLSFIEKIIVIDRNESTPEAESMQDFVCKNTKSPVSRILTTPVNAKESVAVILSSSGSTGLPKGVMLTHRNIIAVYNHFRDSRLHALDPISLVILPFFHGYGFFVTLTAIMTNDTTVFLKEFIPDLFLKSIQDYKVTRLFLAPPLVIFFARSPLISQYDLSTVNEVLCGAAPLKKSTEDEFKKRLKLKVLRQAYGLTETTIGVTYSNRTTGVFKPGSSGKVAPYMKIAVRDLENGQFLGPNQQGELCVKGETVMKGYCGNPEATRKSFTKDGWLLTGDVGYYDEEGDFFITDRLKELIKYKGFQVAPAELEALLLTNPGVVDCGVVGLPDERSGELPLAFVVKFKESNLSEKDIQDFVKEKLSPQKWLRGGVIFVDSIPKTPTGKILRRELRLMVKKLKSKL